jgi:carbon dioxide concentrating mechanism protein CcmO
VANINAESAIGLVSTQSFPAMIGIADMMLKSAAVTLVGYEKIGGGSCTAVIRGKFPDVRLAVAAGVEVAEQMNEPVYQMVIPRPLPNLEAVLPINRRLLENINGRSQLSNYAVGLLETCGFPAMVGAMDTMLKTADIYVSGYEKTGSGLCTAVIRGTVSNVTFAIDAGMTTAEMIGDLRSVMVIPRPLEDLELTLPTASCWIEKPVALPMRLPQAATVATPALAESRPLVELDALPAAPEGERLPLMLDGERQDLP